MSASRDNKAGEGATFVQRRNDRQEKSGRKKHLIYGVVGGVIAVLAIALLVWDSGFFQKRAVALTVDGENFTPGAVQYYYNSAYNNTRYYAMMGYLSDYDTSKDPEDQMYDEAEGTTWHDYFLDQAVEQLTQLAAVNHAAEKEGYALSDVGQAYLDDQLSQLDRTWRSSGSYASLTAYLRTNFGSYVDEKTVKNLITDQVTATFYQQDHQDSLTYTDEALDAYYQEHANELDTFDYSVFTVQASVTEETDADGNTVEMTDEEKQAAFDAAKAEAQALAQELRSRLSAGGDADALIEEYGDRLYSSTAHASAPGSSFSSASYADWLYDASRQLGDLDIQENDRSDSYVYNYYVVRFEGRDKDESATADVRHILVSAGSSPSDEDYAAAQEKAQAMLEQWQADGGTEESFAVLATRNSADSGSTLTGGLYTGVSRYSGFVDTFTDWCLDSSRQAGDTGIVKNEGSSTKGWHILYFVGWDDPYWKVTARSALQESDMSDWTDSLTQGIEAVRGSGMQYV